VLNTKANCIVIEDLSKIKSKDKGAKFNNKLSQVPFFMFKQILSYKAQDLGKRVETVNPAYSSKDDFRSIESGKRVGCRYYASDKKVF
jgi:IS605 OrfB family transposase